MSERLDGHTRARRPVFNGLCAAIALLLCTVSFHAEAAAITKEKAYNPQPMAGDVIISLPCDGSMVFRKVYTSDSNDKLKDFAFTAGAVEADSKVSEAPTHRYIQGSFHDKHGYYYLMSKYEVTQGQYKLLSLVDNKDAKCPTTITIRDCFPQASISWFDAVNATRQLSMYLGKSEKSKLPETVFARLPTDVEWEFATRGGMEVTTAQFNSAVFPFQKSSDSIADYAWYKGVDSASDGKVRPIGLKKPNPLGFYDILGNVSEMMFDSFHATRTGRLHGQSGGFIIRGGSITGTKGDMVSASRNERNYFNSRAEETKSRDMGFRIVLSQPVVTSISEVRQLNAEVEKLGLDDEHTLANKKNLTTIARLDKIIQEQKNNQDKMSKSNTELKSSINTLNDELGRLRLDMVEANTLRDEMRDKAIISSLRLGGYLCSSLALQKISLEQNEAKEKVIRRLPIRACREDSGSKECRSAEREQEQMLQHNRELAERTLQFYVDYYADHVAVLLDAFNLKDVDQQKDAALHDTGVRQSALGAYILQFIQDVHDYKNNSRDLSANTKRWVKQCRALKK